MTKHVLNKFRVFQRNRYLISAISAIILISTFFGVIFYSASVRAPSINKAQDNSPFYYQSSNSVFNVYIGTKKNNYPEVRFAVGKSTINFVPANPDANIPTPTFDNNKVTFKNVYPDTSFEYQTLPNGIKENIIVNKHNNVVNYPFYIAYTNANPRFVTTNSNGTAFYDDSGKYLFHFEAPYAIDAKGERTNKVGYVFNNDSQGKILAILTVDPNWLNDPKRSYPVTIDPTVVHNTSTLFSLGQLNRVADSGSGSAPNLETGYQELGADIHTVGLWHLNEASGTTVADSSGNGNTGTISGATLTTGKISNAASFSATTNNIYTSDVSLGFSKTITAEAWVYPTAANSTNIIVSQWYPGGLVGAHGVFSLSYNATYQLGFSVESSSQSLHNLTSTSTLPPNTWSHVAATFDGNSGTINLYINGNLVSSSAGTAGIINPTAWPVVIGDPLNSTTGKIDEVRLSNIVRTPEEIKLDAQRRPYSVYTSNIIDLGNKPISLNSLSWSGLGYATGDGETGTPSATSNLVAQWDFNGTSGTTATSSGTCGTSCNGTYYDPLPTGGNTVADIGGYRIHTFTSTGTLTVPTDRSVEVLVVGGGGGGGGSNGAGGGGGAGGVTYNASVAVSAQAYTVTVGTGGAGSSPTGGTNTNGNTSSLGALVSVTGGGAGGGYNGSSTTAPNTGGSGGGGGSSASGSFTGAAGTAGQGNAGGNGRATSTTTAQAGGGGGGAGAVGQASAATYGGDGGDGFTSSITGSSVVYGGGGGGGKRSTGSAGNGGSGGGGKGGLSAAGSIGTNGLGGGGGAGANGYSGGRGGDGVVIVRYPYNPPSVTSGWTTTNQRWGAGAFMFDGVNDGVSLSGDPAAVSFDYNTPFSIGAWVKTSALGVQQSIVTKMANSAPYTGYDLHLMPTGQLELHIINTWPTNNITIKTANPVSAGNWHYVVMTYSGNSAASGAKLYVDGVAQPTTTVYDNLSASTITSTNVAIGSRGNTAVYFNGIIDSTAIYNRALTAGEVISNYNSSRLDMQTRVGNSTDPNDGTWEAWRPTTGETQINSFDSDSSNWDWDLSTATANIPTVKSDDSNIKMEGAGSMKVVAGQLQADANTVGLWHLDETSGTGAYLKDSTANANNGTPTGTTVVDGISSKGRSFNGTSSDYITIANNAALTPASISAEIWVKPTALPTSGGVMGVIDKRDNTGGTAGYFIELYNNGGTQQVAWASAGSSVNVNYTLPLNVWTHIVATQTGTSAILYINGTQMGTGTVTALTNYATALLIGKRSDGGYFNGSIDEVRISDVARSAEQIMESYRLTANHYLNRSIASTNLSSINKLPFYVASDRLGTFSQLTIGNSAFANNQPDANTVGLWHMDESSAAPTIQDASGNGNTGQPKIMGDATGGTISYSGGYTIHTFNSSSTFTLPAGGSGGNVQVLVVGGGGGGAGVGGGGGAGGYQYNASFAITPQTYNVTVGDGGAQDSIGNNSVFSTITANGGGTGGGFNAGGGNGGSGGGGGPSLTIHQAGGTGSQGYNGGTGGHNATSWGGGGGGGGAGAVGVSATGTAGTNGGAGVTNPITGTAVCGGGGGGEVGGTVGTGGTGGGGNANINAAGSPGTPNTGGGGGGGSWNNPNGMGGGKGGSGVVIIRYPTNSFILNSYSSPTQGKIGKGISFNGSSDFIDTGSGIDLANSSFTISAWAKQGATGIYNHILSKGTAGTDTLLHFGFRDTNVFTCAFYSDDLNTVATYTDTNWHLWTCTYDTNTKARKIYQDGVLQASGTAAANYTGSGSLLIGKYPAVYYNGSIDEVRIDNTARSADEIRQAYEMSARTHNITIDFKAKLGAGNLITGSGDLGFTVDETAYGSYLAANHLFLGDKIIVKENVNGTEYIAQGTVNAVNSSTGAVTVTAWDAGSTFPGSGYTVNSIVFKWQREYFDLTGSLATHRNAITNLTYRITDGSQGVNVWIDDLKYSTGNLTNPLGSAITSSVSNRYFQYRAISTTNDTNVSASITSTTLDYTPNSPPTLPSLDSPADGSTQYFLPTLKTTSTDANSDYLRYKIVLCKDSDMSFDCQTFTQPSVYPQTGWSGQDAESDGTHFTAYASGTQAVYTIQTPLIPRTTYYWKSYAIDPGGSIIWSSTQVTPFSFTTSPPVRSPTSLLTNGLVNPTSVTSTNPYFSAICEGSFAGQTFTKYQIQVSIDSTFGSILWDSGSAGTSMTTCNVGSRSQDITYGGTALPLDQKVYFWRIKFWDSDGSQGPFSESEAKFQMLSIAPTSCKIQETPDDTSLTLVWTDNSGGTTPFRIEKNVDAAGFSLLTSPAAGVTSYQDSVITDGHTYQYQIRAEGATNSSYCVTDTLSLQTGTFSLEGLDLNGLNLR